MLASLARQAMRLPPDRVVQSMSVPSSAPKKPAWIASLSLGLPSDYSTLALLCKQEDAAPGPPDVHGKRPAKVRVYDCPFLKRYEKGTPYATIADDVKELLRDPRLEKSTLVLERTAVGLPVVQLFRGAKARLVPVCLVTSSLQHAPDGLGGWTVPKSALTSLMQVLVAGRRPGCPEEPLFACADGIGELAAQLEQEWITFTPKVNVSTGSEPPLAWRESINEDLCLAVACGCWAGEYVMRRLAISV